MFRQAGLDYVSCSPFRVPIARLAAAHVIPTTSTRPGLRSVEGEYPYARRPSSRPRPGVVVPSGRERPSADRQRISRGSSARNHRPNRRRGSSSARENFAYLDVEPWHWFALGFITVLVIVDLLVHRTAHVISFKEAAIESAVWISIGLAFTGVIYILAVSGDGHQAAGEYLSAS